MQPRQTPTSVELSQLQNNVASVAHHSASERHFASRCAVLKLLDHVLCAREMRMLALREFYVVNTVCSLLVESPTSVDGAYSHAMPLLRGFTLRILTDLMMISQSHVAGAAISLPHSTSANAESGEKRLSTKTHLFTKFIELLPRFSDDFHLSRGLLHGIRRVLALSRRGLAVAGTGSNVVSHANMNSLVPDLDRRSGLMSIPDEIRAAATVATGSRSIQFTVANGRATSSDACDSDVFHTSSGASTDLRSFSESGLELEANQNLFRDQNALSRVHDVSMRVLNHHVQTITSIPLSLARALSVFC